MQNVIRRPRQVAGFRGTMRYAAMGVHENRDQCRKDDVEGWFYTTIELLTGNLHWKNIDDNAQVGPFTLVCKCISCSIFRC